MAMCPKGTGPQCSKYITATANTQGAELPHSATWGAYIAEGKHSTSVALLRTQPRKFSLTNYYHIHSSLIRNGSESQN